jgi:HNH endonuclease
MSFSESLKSTVRKRAHFCCCLCHDLGVEIHHIVPQAEGGSDDEENAAPLCPSCHEKYGGNPEKRKFIREVRDFRYEMCENKFNTKQLNDIAEKLQHLATKEDLERVALRNASYVLGTASDAADDIRYSLEREEFIHPLIVRELLGWLSDRTATVVAVDLTSANRSNHFFGKFNHGVRNGRTWVKWSGENGESFSYVYIATSPSGIRMVECHDCTGGTGIFGRVALFSLERDQSIEQDVERVSSRPRILLKTLGSIGLGDRYDGEITYSNGFLNIGPDHGWYNRGESASKVLRIE